MTESYHSKDFKPATKYGTLILKHRNGIVNVQNIRLYDMQRYNWCERIIGGGYLMYHTDQSYDLKATPSMLLLKEYITIHLDGVLLYKRPWWRL
jgi:hypothetical protein